MLERLEKITICLLLASGLCTFCVLGCFFFGIYPSKLFLVLCFFVLFFALYLSDPFAGRKKTAFYFSNLEKALGVLIAFQVVSVFLTALKVPIMEDDAISIWGGKYQYIYHWLQAKGEFLGLLSGVSKTLSGNYPLLIPLQETILAILFGYSTLLPKIIFPIYYLIFLLLLYFFFYKTIGQKIAMVFTFFLAFSPFISEQATMALADLPFTCYYFLSFIFLWYWMDDGKKRNLFLSAICSILSIWTKNEGYPSLIILMIVLTLFLIEKKEKICVKGIFFYLLILISGIFIIRSYQAATGVSEGIINQKTMTLQHLIEHLHRVPYILDQFQRQMFGALNKWGFLFIFWFITSLANLKGLLKGRGKYALLLIFLNYLLYILVYILSPHDINHHMNTSQNRILMHISPFILFHSAFLYDAIKSKALPKRAI